MNKRLAVVMMVWIFSTTIKTTWAITTVPAAGDDDRANGLDAMAMCKEYRDQYTTVYLAGAKDRYLACLAAQPGHHCHADGTCRKITPPRADTDPDRCWLQLNQDLHHLTAYYANWTKAAIIGQCYFPDSPPR
jgi:hypothetical protein